MLPSYRTRGEVQGTVAIHGRVQNGKKKPLEIGGVPDFRKMIGIPWCASIGRMPRPMSLG